MFRVSVSLVGFVLFLKSVSPATHQQEVWPEHIAKNFESYQEAKKQHELEQEIEERLNRFRRDMFAFRVLKSGMQNQKILHALDLTNDQENQLNLLIEEYEKEENRVREKFSGAENLDQVVTKKMVALNQELTIRASEILVDFQLDELVKMNILKSGAPRLLTDTKMGDALGLSEEQKERIKSKSRRISQKVAEFVHDSRREAFKAVYSELNQDQQQTLREIYGDKVIGNYFEGIPLYSVYAHYRFPEDGEKVIPGVLRTKIAELH